MRSAEVATWTVTEAELLPGVGSVVVELTVAVFEIELPFGLLGSTVALILTIWEVPAPMSPRLIELLPGQGVSGVQGPVVSTQYIGFCNDESRTSLRLTAAASEGPLFVTVIV